MNNYKGVFRIRKSKDNTMANRKKDRRRNNGLQNPTQKTKDRATLAPLNIEGAFRCPEGLAAAAPLVIPIMLRLNYTNII